MREDPSALGIIANPGQSPLLRRHPGNVAPFKNDSTAVRLVKADHALQRGGLSHAVAPHHTKYMIGTELQTHVAQDPGAADRDAELVNAQDGLRHVFSFFPDTPRSPARHSGPGRAILRTEYGPDEGQ